MKKRDLNPVKKTFQKLPSKSLPKYCQIFMYCNMLLMNGYEATEKIREYSKDNQPTIVTCT
jgi:CheY-like chemotaxis protein